MCPPPKKKIAYPGTGVTLHWVGHLPSILSTLVQSPASHKVSQVSPGVISLFRAKNNKQEGNLLIFENVMLKVLRKIKGETILVTEKNEIHSTSPETT